jgi:hypothetical protein
MDNKADAKIVPRTQRGSPVSATTYGGTIRSEVGTDRIDTFRCGSADQKDLEGHCNDHLRVLAAQLSMECRGGRDGFKWRAEHYFLDQLNMKTSFDGACPPSFLVRTVTGSVGLFV